MDFQVGRLGTITPVAHLTPVLLAGTTVSRASLHNFDQIERLNVRVGDTVVVEKAGEIIPQVVSVVMEKRPHDAKIIHPPAKCPVCQGQVERDEGGVALRCINPECGAQLRERLRFFTARDQMDIAHLGPALIDQLVDAGLVHHFADIYKLRLEDLLPLERMAEKSAQNVIDAIAAAKDRPLSRLLAALGIRHVGGRAAEVLAKKYGNIDDLANASLKELTEVNEIGPVIAASLREFFTSPSGKEVIARLKEAGVRMDEPRRAAAEGKGPLAGKIVVITGTLEKFSRTEAEQAVADAGGRATSSVSAKTDFLVAGADAGSKLDKARSLNVEVIDEKEFVRRLKK